MTPIRASSPAATPAYVDVATFQFHADNERHKVIATLGPTMLRVDEPEDRYSVIYNPQTQDYLGLEHRNYTYWVFSWPQIRAAVENSKRGEARLQQLTIDGLNDDSMTLNSHPEDSGTSSSASDDSGYVWKQAGDKKRIAGFDCVRWTGDTLSGENVEAWCYPGAVPAVKAVVDQFKVINGPMALVPIRTVVPDFIFAVYDGLTKAGVTPLLIQWSGAPAQNEFELVDLKRREARPDTFVAPKLYVKTTLETMDGIIDQQPYRSRSDTGKTPQVDNSLPAPSSPGR